MQMRENGILVFCCYYNKIPHTELLKQHKLTDDLTVLESTYVPVYVTICRKFGMCFTRPTPGLQQSLVSFRKVFTVAGC